MNKGAFIVSSVIGAMFTGAIAGAAAESSDHPVIKGAVVAGVVNGLLAAAMITGYEAAGANLQQGSVSGAPRALSDPRFP